MRHLARLGPAHTFVIGEERIHRLPRRKSDIVDSWRGSRLTHVHRENQDI